MKLIFVLSALCTLFLTGCPKKPADGEHPAEQVEGASTSDKTGEASSDEMQ